MRNGSCVAVTAVGLALVGCRHNSAAAAVEAREAPSAALNLTTDLEIPQAIDSLRIELVDLGQPAAAARAFAQVRQLAPAGALVEDALAREAEALEQAGQHEAAQKLVQEYLKQYPTGRRSERLRQLVNH